MILSSADILRILGGSEIIRLSASLRIVDGKPVLSGREGIHIHVNRFPSLQEFEATWQIWIEADEEDDLVVAELQRLLPRVQIVRGLMTTATTTEFRSGNTQEAPEAPEPQKAQVNESAIEERFQELVEDIQDQMLLVTSGRAGKDGRDGNDGQDGRDGRDLVATEAELFDLKDVNPSPIPLEKGQVLTWDGEKWTNLYVRQTSTVGGGGGGGGSSDVKVLNDLEDVTTEGVLDGQFLQYDSSTEEWQPVSIAPGGGIPEAPVDGQQYARQDAAWTPVAPGGIEEAPQDGNFYVRQDGQWIDLRSALNTLENSIIDGGDFLKGTSQGDDETIDGGNWSNA